MRLILKINRCHSFKKTSNQQRSNNNTNQQKAKLNKHSKNQNKKQRFDLCMNNIYSDYL